MRRRFTGPGSAVAQACMVVITSACPGSPPPVHPTAEPEPAPVAAIAVPAPRPPSPEPEPAPTPVPIKKTPELVRAEGRLTVTLHEPVEELLVTSRALVWIHNGAVWAALDGREDAQLLARQADPHGLAGDDDALYWAGAERHVRHVWATGEQTDIPGLDPRSWQVQGFAMAPTPAVLVDAPITLWRIRWPGPRLAAVRMRVDPGWRRATDLRAGGSSLFFSVFIASGADVGASLVMVDARDRLHVRRTGRTPLRRGAWDVDARGTVVFLADGALHRMGPQDDAPARVLALPDATPVCWCGRRVCSDDAEAREIQAREIRSGAVTTVALDVEPITRLACGPKRLAWSTATSIVSVSLL